MGFIEEYKKLAKSLSPTITREMDITELYSYYGISGKEGTYLRREITDYLQEKILESLKCVKDCELNSYLIRKIKDHFLLEYFYNGSSLEHYHSLDVIKNITHGHGSIKSFAEETSWKIAIQAALDYNELSITYSTPKSLKEHNPGIYNLAKAAKYFKKKGYDVKIRQGKVIIDEADLKKIFKEIEGTIRILGGLEVIENILKQFSSTYDKELNRFNLNRTIGFGKDPLIPIGYLFNLAGKQTNSNLMIKYPEMWNYYYNYLLEISRQLGVIFDAQPYNYFQLMFKGPRTIIEFIQEIAIFDHIFSLVQLRHSDVPRILNGLFKGIDSTEMKRELGFDLDQLINVVEIIFKLSKRNFIPFVFDISSLKYHGDISTLKKILNSLSLDSDKVNKNFIHPLDKCNLFFKPLIKNKDKYILLNKSWNSPSFYESLASELRSKRPWKHLDDVIIGPSLEQFIKSELTRNKIIFKSGSYKIGSISGECDVIIESKSTIIFIEIKKKSLTRASQSGDDVELILDLSKSLLDSQLQIGQHETLLRKEGNIEFEDGSRLYLKDREIERITLTMLDYGGFQDRSVINQILKVMLSVDFSVGIPKYESDFKKLKIKTDKLKKQSEKLAIYDESFDKYPFFNCWFLSLPQLLILIDDSTDTESFVNQLKKVKHIRFMSLDFYFEYSKLKILE